MAKCAWTHPLNMYLLLKLNLKAAKSLEVGNKSWSCCPACLPHHFQLCLAFTAPPQGGVSLTLPKSSL